MCVIINEQNKTLIVSIYFNGLRIFGLRMIAIIVDCFGVDDPRFVLYRSIIPPLVVKMIIGNEMYYFHKKCITLD